MFELPEILTLAQQMNEVMEGRRIRRGRLGNRPHKFVWYNRTHPEFDELTRGKLVGRASARAKWLFLPLEPGYVLLLGECGGKVLFHSEEASAPKKYHLLLEFDDGTALSATTRMWGAFELYEAGQELQREYIKDMRPTPTDPEFDFLYFSSLVGRLRTGKKRSVKGLLTQDQLIPGLGNAIAQDIMFRARLHPRMPLTDLVSEQQRQLFEAITSTVAEVIERGGRYDEYDLRGSRGGYQRLMDKQALERPCPNCSGEIVKLQYLGGACYLCPRCQPS